jgi:hypothetical protein
LFFLKPQVCTILPVNIENFKISVYLKKKSMNKAAAWPKKKREKAVAHVTFD